MLFREEKAVSAKNKQNYLDGINNLITERQKLAEKQRKSYVADIFAQQEKYREDFKDMLGWPLVGYKTSSLPEVKSTKLADEEEFEIFRLEFNIIEGVWMSGLFFKIRGDDKKPLVIVSHGGKGTPELISGIYDNTCNYNDILQRVIKYGVHAFAPQLLLWDDEYGIPFDRKEIDAKLKRVGSSITALEVFGIIRILDFFENKTYVKNFGMVGLSYGGFYTLNTAAVDTRIKSAISCSFFNDRNIICWSDWMWQNSAYKFNDAEIACLCYPRRLCIQMGDKDQLFDYNYTENSFLQVKKLAAEQGVPTDWLDLIIFSGTHEFCKDDASIICLVNDLKK